MRTGISQDIRSVFRCLHLVCSPHPLSKFFSYVKSGANDKFLLGFCPVQREHNVIVKTPFDSELKHARRGVTSRHVHGTGKPRPYKQGATADRPSKEDGIFVLDRQRPKKCSRSTGRVRCVLPRTFFTLPEPRSASTMRSNKAAQPHKSSNSNTRRFKPLLSLNNHSQTLNGTGSRTLLALAWRRYLLNMKTAGLPYLKLLVKWKGGEEAWKPYENVAETEVLGRYDCLWTGYYRYSAALQLGPRRPSLSTYCPFDSSIPIASAAATLPKITLLRCWLKAVLGQTSREIDLPSNNIFCRGCCLPGARPVRVHHATGGNNGTPADR